MKNENHNARIITRVHRELLAFLQEEALAKGTTVTRLIVSVLESYVAEEKSFVLSPLADMYLLSAGRKQDGEHGSLLSPQMTLYVSADTREFLCNLAKDCAVKNSAILTSILVEHLDHQNLLR